MARHLSVPEKHQLKIARQTLKYSDVGARIMGGPTKAEAREIIRRLTGQVPRENPAGIRAQVRRLPSGQVQIKIPLKGGRRGNPVYLEDVEGKPLGRRLEKLRRYGDHLLKSDLSVTEVAQRLRGVLGRIMDNATITVDDGKGHRAYNPRDKYEVIVGNIGSVHSGRDLKKAIRVFNEYAEQSQGNYGRAAGENVTLMRDGEPYKEYYGTQENPRGRRMCNPEGKKYWQYPWVVLLKSSATGTVTALTEPHSRGFNTEREAQAYGKRLKRSPVAAGRHVELVRNTKVA